MLGNQQLVAAGQQWWGLLALRWETTMHIEESWQAATAAVPLSDGSFPLLPRALCCISGKPLHTTFPNVALSLEKHHWNCTKPGPTQIIASVEILLFSSDIFSPLTNVAVWGEVSAWITCLPWTSGCLGGKAYSVTPANSCSQSELREDAADAKYLHTDVS